MGTPIRRILTSKTLFFNLADFISCVKPCRKIRSSCSSKNPCTAALPPVRVQLSPQCTCKSTNFICKSALDYKKNVENLWLEGMEGKKASF